MDVHIGEVRSEVRAVDDRSLLSPDVLGRIVSEVMGAMQSRRSSEERRAEDEQLWSSVRAGTGR